MSSMVTASMTSPPGATLTSQEGCIMSSTLNDDSGRFVISERFPVHCHLCGAWCERHGLEQSERESKDKDTAVKAKISVITTGL